MEMVVRNVSVPVRHTRKSENVKKKKEAVRKTWQIAVVITMAVMMSIMVYCMNAMAAQYENYMSAVQSDHTIQIQQIRSDYEAQIKELIAGYDTQLEEQAAQIELLTEQVNQRSADSNELFELARKYWYVFRDAPDDSGLTMDQIVLIDDLCKEDDLNPHIMMCIYKQESGFTAVIDNYSDSGARGLGQVMPATGKSIYENVLGLGSYTHDMAYNPSVNILITEELIARNVDGGLYNAIACYSGDTSGGYYSKLLSVANEYGVDITDTSYQ